jgi:hypothetical protein
MRRALVGVFKLACGAALVAACGGSGSSIGQSSASGGGSVASGGAEANGTGGAGCPDGTERCPCHANGICNEGLVCASDVCVDLSSGGVGGSTSAPATPPCDILDAAGHPCVSAHSTVRVLSSAYSGPPSRP